jgi:diguanylate cyclase
VLPFTELKIDRSKVDGCSRAPSQYLECRQIVELAHRLGMTAVAEGVEQADDLAALVAMQCDVGQGAIFAWPMEREEFKQRVARA